MEAVERTRPNANFVPIILWSLGGTFTNKVTGEVRALGPDVGVGAIDPNDLADELIVPMGGLQVAIRLPKNSNPPTGCRFFGRFFCRRRPLISDLCAVLPRRRSIWLDMFDGQKRTARKAKGKMRPL